MVILAGGVIAASASTTRQTNDQYWACLNSTAGTLSKVTVNATPKCSAPSRVITWNSQGPKGPAGASGAAGQRGSLWTTGVGAPSLNSSQQSGDLYLDTVTGNVYELTAGSWSIEGDVEGPKGPAGASGAAGQGGSLWTTGVGAPSLNSSQQSGDLYLDTATGNVYELAAGSWTIEDNIQGPSGSGYAAVPLSAYPGVDYDGCASSLDLAYFDQNLLGAQFAGADLGTSAFLWRFQL